MTAPARLARAEEAGELYRTGLSLRAVGARLGVSYATVQADLERIGVPLRHRHLAAVRELPQQLAPLEVPPERAAVAFTADRGWHLVDAPSGWLLDLLAELD